MTKIVSIAGEARAGKDTLAGFLQTELENRGKRVLIMHYADLLKYICKMYLGWDGNKDEKGRTLLQYEGTNFVRAKKPTYWVDFVVGFVELYGERFDYIIIPDNRFPNEIDVWKSKDYDNVSIKIERLDYVSELTEEQKKHPSERALDGYEFDIVVKCASGVENIKRMVENELIGQII